MSDPTKEPFETRLVATSAIKVKPSHRKHGKKSLTDLAQSIEDVGLLQAIGVTSSGDDEYTLVFGGGRLAAHKQLKRDVIEVRILDIDETDSETIMHVENLHREELSKSDRLEAIAAWAAHYKAKHPESFGTEARSRVKRKPVPAAAVEAEAPAESEAAATVVPSATVPVAVAATPFPAPAVVADRPDIALAKVMGVQPRQARKALAIAEKLTKEQRDSLLESKVSVTSMEKVASIADIAKRDKAVTLIASGMDADAAIAVAKAPANATLEHVANPDADGYKPEEEMTDDEWFDAFCGETAAKLKYVVAYKANAILWRQTRQARAEFKAKLKKPLSQSKVGVKGPLHYMLARVVNVAHPKDWPFCGPCSGSGQAGNVSKCPTCNGNAFAVKTEAA